MDHRLRELATFPIVHLKCAKCQIVLNVCLILFAFPKFVGDVPLQPRIHFVGKRLEVVHGERVLVGRHSSVQTHHVWPAARDPQRQVDVGQRVHALEKLCELRVQAGIQDGPS